MIKTVKSREELFIEFTDEEIEYFGWRKGQKFTFKSVGDGSFELIPYQKVDIVLSNFSRETLEFLIKESCEKDCSINDIIEASLEEFVSL